VNPTDEWRPVPGWPMYEVSRRGRARRGTRELKPARDKDGYRYVTLSAGRARWRVHVARLVLLVFAGEPPSAAHEACHGNGRRWDNRLANLRWDTRPANRADRERHRRAREARAEIRAARADLGAETCRASTGFGGREADSGDIAPCPMTIGKPQEGSGR